MTSNAYSPRLNSQLLTLHPVPILLQRVRGELTEVFSAEQAIRISRAPGRLDVMGGIADYTGSLVCQATLDRAAAVALQPRPDRTVKVISLNLRDEGHSGSFDLSIDELVKLTLEQLRVRLDHLDRRWAGYLLGCMAVLHEQKLIDLNDPTTRGMSLALYSTVPLGAGVSSSAAIEVATMMALRDHFSLDTKMTPMSLSVLCQRVENQVVGAPCGIMDQAASCAGVESELLRLLCQPHELQPPLQLPQGIRAIGINSNVKHSVGASMYPITRCAAFMGHRMILEKMRQIGAAAGRTLSDDPMNGYLANLPLEDYKTYFRSYLPESMKGADFIAQFGTTIDHATAVAPELDYHVQLATDHHVFEASRVRSFVEFIEQADALDAHDPQRSRLLHMAGHMMYASDRSYRQQALLGAPECELLVDLVRHYKPAGFYGGKITGGGCGGTVAILCRADARADEVIGQIMQRYEQHTGRKPEAFTASSPGAWQVGTALSA